MGLLTNARAYLAGPVDNANDPSGWRNQITSFLKSYNIYVYDPLVKAKWLPETTKVHPSEYYKTLYEPEETNSTIHDTFDGLGAVRKMCHAHVSACDFIICHLPKLFTFGTIAELERASQMGKPVLFHVPDGIPSTWSLHQFADPDNWKKTFFDNWRDLKDHISRINNGDEQIDPYKWVHISYTKLFNEKLDHVK